MTERERLTLRLATAWHRLRVVLPEQHREQADRITAALRALTEAAAQKKAA